MKPKSLYCPVCRHIVCQACGDISIMSRIEQSLLSCISSIQCVNCGCFSDVDIGIRDHSLINNYDCSPIHQHKIRKGSVSDPKLNTKTEYIKDLSSSEGLGDIGIFIRDMQLGLMKMFMFRPMNPVEVSFGSSSVTKMQKEQQKLENQCILPEDNK